MNTHQRVQYHGTVPTRREQSRGELTLHLGHILKTSISIFGRIELKMNAIGLIEMKLHTNKTISLL